MTGIDRYAYLSRLRRVDPIPKLFLACATAVCCLCCGGIAVGLSTVVLLGGLTVGLGGISPRALLRAYRAPLAFLIIGCLTIAVERRDAGSGMLLAVTLGGSLWGFSADSLRLAAGILCRALGVVAAMYFLAFDTPMTDLCLGLERLHVPKLFVELMELIYRFIFVLTDAAGRIRVAQESRLGYAGLRRSLDSTGTLASMVFLRAWKQGERVFSALESRGYTGSLSTLPGHYESGRGLYAWAAGAVAVQLFIFCLERGAIL